MCNFLALLSYLIIVKALMPYQGIVQDLIFYPGIVQDLLSYLRIVKALLPYSEIVQDLLSYPWIVQDLLSYPGIVQDLGCPIQELSRPCPRSSKILIFVVYGNLVNQCLRYLNSLQKYVNKSHPPLSPVLLVLHLFYVIVTYLCRFEIT